MRGPKTEKMKLTCHPELRKRDRAWGFKEEGAVYRAVRG